MNGASTVEKALELQNEVIQILQSGGLPICIWTSNSEKLLLNVPPEDLEVSLPLDIELENTVKDWASIETQQQMNFNIV